MDEAVILAGGKGTRLRPYTVVIPKPMLPIGGIPIIEMISRQLRYHNFLDVTISLGYLSEYIETFINTKTNLSEFPQFKYIKEVEPKGTSGSLKNCEIKSQNFLVINGDILTTLDLRQMFNTHIKEEALLTIGIRKTSYKLPLGSIEIDGNYNVVKFNEKPEIELFDNIGVYVYSKQALRYINDGEKIDVNVLVERLILDNKKILAYRDDGPYYWIDIGTHADFEQANRDFETIRASIPYLREVN